MENTQAPSTYLSPLTGRSYSVVPVTKIRAVGGWLEGTPLRNEEYTQYDIYFDGRWVQFAFEPEGIASSVANYEGVSDGWYCSPRD